MPILAIETSTQWCSVAIYFSEEHYFSKHEKIDNKASQFILPWINDLMSESSVQWSDLEAIAVSIGPGSFTGIRLGIGVAQGLAFARKIPLVPVASLDGMLANHLYILKNEISPQKLIHVLLDARMEQAYYRSYNLQSDKTLRCNGDIQLLNIKDINLNLSDAYLTFEMQSFLQNSCIIETNNVYMATPNALGIAYCAAKNSTFDGFLPQNCYPLYVRDQVALSIAQRALLLKKEDQGVG